MAHTVLVVAPHGLDEVLGCGGTMARHADEGDSVYAFVLFGDGTGRDAARRLNAQKAAKILGAHPPRFSGFPENRSDAIPLLDIVGAIERCVGELKAQIVYVSHAGNLNIDHQTSFRATATALRPLPDSTVRALYAYEILSSTDWATPGIGDPFTPTRYVDITNQLRRKLEALEIYKEEMRPRPHARSIESARALALLRGGSVGVSAAEAFATIRELITA